MNKMRAICIELQFLSQLCLKLTGLSPPGLLCCDHANVVLLQGLDFERNRSLLIIKPADFVTLGASLRHSICYV